MQIQYDNRSLQERGIQRTTERHFDISPPLGIELDEGERREYPTWTQDGSVAKRRRLYRYPERQQLFDAEVIPLVFEWVDGDHKQPSAYNFKNLRRSKEVWVFSNEIEVWLAWQNDLDSLCFFNDRPEQHDIAVTLQFLKESGCETLRVMLPNNSAGRALSVDLNRSCKLLKIKCIVYDLSITEKDNECMQAIYDACSLTKDIGFRDAIFKQEVISQAGLDIWQAQKAASQEEDSLEDQELLRNLTKAIRQCPTCGARAIIADTFNDGWMCWKKKDGCGRRFPRGTEEIESQMLVVKNVDVADFLIEMVAADELFHTDSGGRFISIQRADKKSTYSLYEEEFTSWLVSQYYDYTKKAIKQEYVKTALLTLSARAKVKGDLHKSNIRTAWYNDCIYIDLCNEKGEVVQVSDKGWRVTGCPVGLFFLRTNGMLEMPSPIPHPDGSRAAWDAFRSIINIGGDRNWIMLTSWMVAALMPNRFPCPVLRIAGEKGTGKSTLTRLARNSVDPNVASSLQKPKDEQDVILSAMSSRVLAVDNLSNISQSLNDCLAALVSGIPYKTRKFFTNSEEVIFTGKPAMILNGIPDTLGESDLNDRALKITLPVISETADGHEDEEELENRWARNQPYLFAAMLDALALYVANRDEMRNMSAGLKIPRMADFTRAMIACEAAMPFSSGEFYSSYVENIREVAQLENESTFPQTIMTYVASKEDDVFEIEARHLFSEMTDHFIRQRISQEDYNIVNLRWTPEGRQEGMKDLYNRAEIMAMKDRSWPKTVVEMKEKIARAASGLRKSGGVDIQRIDGGYRFVNMGRMQDVFDEEPNDG